MRFTERKEWHYDGLLVKRADVQTALAIHAEYIDKNTPIPPPKFLEVDRRSEKFDPLWHVSLDERTVYSRTLDIPAIVKASKPDWRLTKAGLTPQQQYKFYVANLHLEEYDYFPMRGDLIYYNGYRNMIVNVVLEPESYWLQTNIWLGLVCETIIPADGDARPVTNMGELAPRENIQTRPAPEV